MRDERSRASIETGESSTHGGLLEPGTSSDRALAFSDDEALPRSHSGERDQREVRTKSRDGRSRRTRTRPSGGFLLQDTVVGDDDPDTQRRTSRKMPQFKSKDASNSRSLSSSRGDASFRYDAKNERKLAYITPEGSQEELVVRKREKSSRDGSKASASPPHPSALDVDSTQIVNMALNLSESRRMASRRTVSRANPPRLTPIPDATPGGNLRAHLQQQRRKSSRNISPRPAQSLMPRLPSGLRSSSPLQAAFDAGHDNTYRYHFSTSTLSRAQKAKDHLELMAQYRRLLEILPPLKSSLDLSSGTGPSLSPVNTKFGTEINPVVGREYNPLQYIRNRKVRAREQKAIDGERQGFTDVDTVRLWVDIASRRAPSVAISTADGNSILPPFPGPEDADIEGSPDASGKAALRLRRPRVDWFFEPCDMIADAYWLEQDHHKQLIEDRQWCKIFPQSNPLSRPMSQNADDYGNSITPFTTRTREDMDGLSDTKNNLKLIRPGTDNSQSSTKERAKQKLQDMRVFHKHTVSTHSHHDHFRPGRDSLDLSGSDNEGKKEGKLRRSRQARAGTLSSNTNDLLEKQLLEMIAQEAKEQQPAITEQAITVTPDVPSKPASRLHSRKGSLTDMSDSDHVSIRDRMSHDYLPIHQHGKLNIDIPGRVRPASLDADSSIPTSPELYGQRDQLYKTSTAVDLSPSSSRSSSPSRNPFSKVKQIFRDKSREDANESHAIDTDDDDDRRRSFQEVLSPTESKSSPEARQSNARVANDNSKSHRTLGNTKTKSEEQVGVRGIFKGGVSRLGDLFWKKDMSHEAVTEAPSTDSSDTEPSRGRPRISLTLSRVDSKRQRTESQQPHKHHFLDSMPQFQHASELQKKPSFIDNQHLSPELTRPQSRQSPRFDLLKPPKIDIRNASEASSHRTTNINKNNSETSDAESHQDGPPVSKLEVSTRSSSMMAMPSFDQRDRSQSRHWSITDRDTPRRAQLSKREIARMRALILTSGIKAMEISRRANEPHTPLSKGSIKTGPGLRRSSVVGVPWADIASLSPEELFPADQQVAYCNHYTLASHTLNHAIQHACQQRKASADRFEKHTIPNLHKRVGSVRSRVADDLSGMARDAADLADETSKDLAVGQRLKAKHVIDVIEKMMRNRRRRFRWVRRGMWLVVEWTLVGFMWYVWFIVVILRVFLGIGQGVWRGVRWLLWI